MKMTASRAALSIPAANAPALCVVDQTEVDAGAGAHTGCEDVHTAQLFVSLLTSDRTFHGFEKGSTTSYSYDETLVTVSSTGFVTANSVGKTGPVTITASVSPYQFAKSVTIVVEKPSQIPVTTPSAWICVARPAQAFVITALNRDGSSQPRSRPCAIETMYMAVPLLSR